MVAQLVHHHMPAYDEEEPALALEEEAAGPGGQTVAVKGETRASVSSNDSIMSGRYWRSRQAGDANFANSRE